MKIIQHKLKNGITVLLAQIPHSHLSNVHVGVSIGSNQEEEHQHGLAHIFEHMCFKGTKKYPDYKDLVKEMDKFGFFANAFTSNEKTAYHLEGLNKHLDHMLDLTSEIFLNSIFPEMELEKEKGVVLEEIKMCIDSPGRFAYDTVVQELFKNTPMGHKILGTPESVKSFSRKDFVSFLEKYYVAQNTVISIAGNFDERHVLEKLENLYSSARTGKHKDTKEINLSPVKEHHQSVQRTEKQQTTIYIGFPSYSKNDSKHDATLLLSNILGNGFSSRLFMNIREDKGLCYTIGSSQNSFSTIGLFDIYAGTGTENVKKVIEEIGVECKRIKESSVSDEELEKAKNKISTCLVSDTQTADSLAYNNLYEYITTGKPINMEEDLKNINEVTKEEVQEVAKNILKGGDSVTCYVGPEKISEEVTEYIKQNLMNLSFKEKVYSIVKKIPKGKTMTYKEVAKKAGSGNASRAVGNLMSKNYNPSIPCHRVIRSDGKIGNYNRGGEKVKSKLLKKEKSYLIFK